MRPPATGRDPTPARPSRLRRVVIVTMMVLLAVWMVLLLRLLIQDL